MTIFQQKTCQSSENSEDDHRSKNKRSIFRICLGPSENSEDDHLSTQRHVNQSSENSEPEDDHFSTRKRVNPQKNLRIPRKFWGWAMFNKKHVNSHKFLKIIIDPLQHCSSHLQNFLRVLRRFVWMINFQQTKMFLRNVWKSSEISEACSPKLGKLIFLSNFWWSLRIINLQHYFDKPQKWTQRNIGHSQLKWTFPNIRHNDGQVSQFSGLSWFW